MSWGTRATLAAVVIALVAVVSRPGTALYPRPASDVVDMSSDGRYVVLSSPATDLIDGDTNGRIRDIYYVAFESAASDLLSVPDTNGKTDVFRWERATGALIRVSVTGLGTEGDDASFSVAISADGQSVAFVSWATNFGGPPDSGLYKNLSIDPRRSS